MSVGQKWLIGGSIGAAVIVIGVIAGAVGAIAGASPKPVVAAADPAEAPAAEDAPPTEQVVTVAIPAITGVTVADARAALESAGLVAVIPAGAADDWVVTGFSPTTDVEKGASVTLEAEAPKPVYTLEQENALESARSYLSFTAFSRQGLIEQLSSEYGEGYPLDVATWAVDTVGADWNAEAVESARSYLDLMSFSRDGLYEQLTSEYGEGFTADEANYALSQVGY